MIQYATDETYDTLVAEGVVLVDFFGVHCGPCKMLARSLEELDDELPFLNIVKVDTDKCPIKTEEFHINGIPDLFFYKDGEVLFHQAGMVDADEIRSELSKILY